jgi:acylphosphatase
MMTQRVFVSGRVQGVSFRDWALRAARDHRVTGWVRNLNDGRVELLVTGEDEAVAAMVEQLREGPPGARIDQLAAHPDQPDGAKGFTRRFTT